MAVISDGLWRRRFGHDPNILGSSLVLDGKSYSVVGVAPPGFHLVDNPAELWIPYTPNPVELTPYWQGLRILRVLAHLKAGISPQAGRNWDAVHCGPAGANESRDQRRI